MATSVNIVWKLPHFTESLTFHSKAFRWSEWKTWSHLWTLYLLPWVSEWPLVWDRSFSVFHLLETSVTINFILSLFSYNCNVLLKLWFLLNSLLPVKIFLSVKHVEYDYFYEKEKKMKKNCYFLASKLLVTNGFLKINPEADLSSP